MNNPIVYVADGTRRTGLHPAITAPYGESVHSFENRRRVSDGKHQIAKAALRAEYQRKAAAVGMSLEAYCARFNVKLFD